MNNIQYYFWRFTWLIVVSFTFFSFNNNPKNNENPLLIWDKKELSRANSAVNLKTLSEEEKKIIFYMNLARINPKKFDSSILKTYLNDENIENSNAIKSLHEDLKSLKPLEEFYVDEELQVLAVNYATSSGAKGQVGHFQFNQRFIKVLKQGKYCGENCQYGYNSAINIVMDLLIDEGIEDYGHRKNILNTKFKLVGVAIRPHKKYNDCTVIEFSSQ